MTNTNFDDLQLEFETFIVSYPIRSFEIIVQVIQLAIQLFFRRKYEFYFVVFKDSVTIQFTGERHYRCIWKKNSRFILNDDICDISSNNATVLEFALMYMVFRVRVGGRVLGAPAPDAVGHGAAAKVRGHFPRGAVRRRRALVARAWLGRHVNVLRVLRLLVQRPDRHAYVPANIVRRQT